MGAGSGLASVAVVSARATLFGFLAEGGAAASSRSAMLPVVDAAGFELVELTLAILTGVTFRGGSGVSSAVTGLAEADS